MRLHPVRLIHLPHLTKELQLLGVWYTRYHEWNKECGRIGGLENWCIRWLIMPPHHPLRISHAENENSSKPLLDSLGYTKWKWWLWVFPKLISYTLWTILVLLVRTLAWEGSSTIAWDLRAKLMFMCVMAYWQSLRVGQKPGRYGTPKSREYGRGLQPPEKGVLADQVGASLGFLLGGDYSLQNPHGAHVTSASLSCGLFSQARGL